jgi:hypothetical protein
MTVTSRNPEGQDPVFKFLYLLSPLLSVTFGVRGYPPIAILGGLACSMAMVLLDNLAIAFRMALGGMGIGVSVGYLGNMRDAMLVMIIPASIWNVAGYAVGWFLGKLV